MTAKKYFLETSNMAYPLNGVQLGFEGWGMDAVWNIRAHIPMTKAYDHAEAIEFLNNNEFFSITPNDFVNRFGESLMNDVPTASFKIELWFHFSVDDIDVYELNVADVIDCSSVPQGRIVLTTMGYKLKTEIRPQLNNDDKAKDGVKDGKSEDKSVDKTESKVTYKNNIFDLFDDFMNPFKENMNRFETVFSDLKTKLAEKPDAKDYSYVFSCKVDPDGHVHMERTHNGDTIKRDFNLKDNENSVPKKIEIQDENANASSHGEEPDIEDDSIDPNDPRTALRHIVEKL